MKPCAHGCWQVWKSNILWTIMLWSYLTFCHHGKGLMYKSVIWRMKQLTFVLLCNCFDGWLDASCHGNTCKSAMNSESVDSYLASHCWMRHRWRRSYMYIFHQLCNGFPCFHHVYVCVCFRCGTTLWLRQLRTGLMPACGSMGHLISSGSWVKTSPSGQDGEWPLTPPPPPWHLLLLSGMTLSLSLSAVMVVALQPPSSFS